MTSNPLILRLQKLSDTFSEEARTETEVAGERSDAELMCLIQRRDHEAFAELFDRYHGTVRAIAKNILKSAEDVDDVVQEAVYGINPFVTPGGGFTSQRNPNESVRCGVVLH